MNSGIDFVTTGVIGNSLNQIAEAMGLTLIQSAFSPNIKERRDCSTALFSSTGATIAQAEHIPLHLGSLLGVVQEVCNRYPLTEIQPGDVFMANDPYSGGGTHLPDVTVVTPLFSVGRPIAFAATNAHHADIGGRVPGGIAGDSRSIYEEGIRVPPIRIVSEGKMCEDVVEMFLLNTRMREARLTDLRGQIAANEIGRNRFERLLSRYGEATLLAAINELLAYGERRFRAAVSRLPDGEYKCVDYLDDDGLGCTDIPIAVTITIAGDQLSLDFTGSGRQVSGAINAVYQALLATVYYAVRAVIDPGVPANGGFHRAVEVRAPAGTIVNASPPAAVGARTDTCQRIAGVILGALAGAVPDRVPAGSNDASTAVVFAGTDPDRGYYVQVEAIGGGGGARPAKDGLDGIQVHVTNTSNLPVESLETEFPLAVDEYSLIPDSGGPGRYRGGLGIRRVIRVRDGRAEFSSHGDRHRRPPAGLAGGGSGACGRYRLRTATGDVSCLPSKVSGIALGPGDSIIVETPGGGGYGDPHERDRDLVSRDVADGKVSDRAARDEYGWER